MMEQFNVRIKAIQYLGQDILAYEFESTDGIDLPPFTAGAHIDVIAENIPVRSYSLYNRFADSHTYKIAINRDENSRGGSVGYQNQLRAGQIIQVSEPRNNFEFRGQKQDVVFIVGGIGITPILSMIEQAQQLNWKLYYFARSAEKCAFAKELLQRFTDRVEIILNKACSDKRLGHIFAEHSAAETEFYCCGPQAMIEEFRSFQATHPHCYYESFAAVHEASTDNSYSVELRKTGKRIDVVQGETLLDALLRKGCDVMHSCKEGICGACETPVLEGEVEHRDSILTDDEKLENKTIFPCCSSAKGKFLVLDI